MIFLLETPMTPKIQLPDTTFFMGFPAGFPCQRKESCPRLTPRHFHALLGCLFRVYFILPLPDIPLIYRPQQFPFVSWLHGTESPNFCGLYNVTDYLAAILQCKKSIKKELHHQTLVRNTDTQFVWWLEVPRRVESVRDGWPPSQERNKTRNCDSGTALLTVNSEPYV